jgi:hypothetical protein
MRLVPEVAQDVNQPAAIVDEEENKGDLVIAIITTVPPFADFL